MKVRQAMGMGLLLVVASLPMHAQVVAPYEDFAKHLRAAQEITPLTSTLFGDKLSLYNGETEFDVTDIDLPGNSSLPVRLTRRFQIQDRRIDPDNLYGFDDWDLDVPYIDGVYTTEDGWQVIGTDYPETGSNSRCSISHPPYTVMADDGNLEEPAAVIWDGNMLHIPGEVDDEELLSNIGGKLPAVADGNTYPWVTKSLYRASCASTTANGYPGESFVVLTPSGVRYTFNWVTSRVAPQVSFQTPNLSGSGTVNAVANRTRFFMLATKVEDRFGNWVTYTYNASSQLTQIAANDGRAINITWSGSSVASATATSPNGTPRTWHYAYGSNGLPTGTLTSVTRPDGSQWTYTIDSGSILSTHEGGDNEPQPSHCQLEPDLDPGAFVYTIGAPSGAQGTFSFVFGRNYRNYVPESCTGSNPYTLYPDTKDFFDNFQLVSKQITGAGLSPQNWTYNYDSNAGSYFLATVLPIDAFEQQTYIPQTTVATKVVTVTDPTEVTKYTFGTSYGLNEGRLRETEVDSLAGTVMKTVTTTYLDDGSIANEPFPDNVGVSIQPVYKNPMVGRQRPEVLTTTVQDGGDTYVHQNVAFDVFARPFQVNKYNNIPGQTALEEQTTYNDNLALWVLGQTQQVINMQTGETETQNVYNPGNATLQSSARFGETLMSYTYNSAGQLATFEDGDSNITTLSNYYRGIPQLINYPDGTSQSATVDDFGDITSVTDQNGHTTSYTYNAVGWPVQITYPTGDEVAWYPTTYAFTYVTTAERGIAGGHWDRTTTTGSAATTTYFDAELRPVLSDTSIPGSDITTANAYDWKGQTLFASYPEAGALALSALTTGTHHQYDALERLIQTQQDSELGPLTTITAYLSGAGEQVTDPKSNVTTTYYQEFDEPSYGAPIQVQAPGGITQTIARDLYGNPTAITQSGLYNGTETDSVTKNLYYDSAHRLCRAFEPESGSTLTTYDGANNVQTTASGMTITEAGCGYDQVPSQAVTTYAYYPMNRVKTIVPPAGTQSTQYLYDAVGNVKSATSGITVWNGNYNYRNMLTSEALTVLGQSAMGIGYAHDAFGHLSIVTYPGGGSNGGSQAIAYGPDALGRPTEVGSYASGVTYWPNGQVASFTYGNGTAYAAAQNTRQLLSNFSYGTGNTLNLSEDFSYDADANILTVQDLINGQRSKIFQYDGLNRLTSAVAPGLSINEAYTYDALNNLRTRLAAGQTNTYNYNPLNQLSTITNGTTTVDTFGYDNLGNQNTKNGNSLQFDQLDQLIQIPNYDTYAYDASGRRVLKTPTGSAAPVYSFYDHGGLLKYQFAPNSGQATNFIYLGTKLIARNAYTQLAAPGAVSFDANPNNGNYTVSWGAVPGATSYTLQESYNGGAWTTFNPGSATSFAFTGKNGGSYVYQVQGCSGTTCGPWTTSATLGVLPALPTNVTVPSGLTFGTYPVSWTGSIGATNYTVQQSFNGGAWTTIDSAVTTTSINVPNGKGGNYTYQVSANNAFGNLGWVGSASVSVTQVPLPPTNFVVPTTGTAGDIILTWNAMPWATSYQLGWTHLNSYTQGMYTYYTDSTQSWNFPLTTGEFDFTLAACSIAGCSATVSGGPLTISAASDTESAIRSWVGTGERILGADSGSGGGCTATGCSVTVGGNP